MIRARSAAAVVAALSLVIAACGDDDGGDDASTETEAPADTDAPDGTEASPETEAPADTEAPGETEAPADAEAPTETDAPDEAEAPADTAPELPTQGVTDTEIKIGGLYHQAGYADFAAGAQARIDRANVEGGVHGRQIVITEWLDDGADSTANADQARKLVEQDGVFGVLALSAALSAGTYFAENKVPYYGWAISPDWCNDFAFGFAGGTCPNNQVPEGINFAVSMERVIEGGDASGQNVVIVGEDNDLAKSATENMVLMWDAEGANTSSFNTIATPPTVVSDFSPFVLDVQDADADVVVIAASPANTIGMITALKTAGFDGDIINFVTYDPRLAQLSEGVYTLLQGMNPWEADDPTVRQMTEDVLAADPDALLSQPLLSGYVSADLMVATLDAAGEDLTTNSFMDAMSDFSYDYGGLAGPVEYPRDHTLSNGCSSVVVGTGDAYEVAAPLECFPLFPNPNYEG